MLLKSVLLLLTTCVSSALAANGTCPTFVAKNSISSTYRVNFYNNGLSSYQSPPLLPANITASSPSKLAQLGHSGAEFTITNCSSTTQSSCTHGSCYTNYITTAQVTRSGLCLTASSRSTNATFSFLPCDISTPDTQLFSLSQYVNYSPNYAAVTSYGEVDFNLIQAENGNYSPFQPIAWYIGNDNRTIESILYSYTQAGLSAKLL